MRSPIPTEPAPSPGIDILNCGAGHIEVRFEKSDPMELERAKRIIGDMLSRGYVLFIEGADKALIRVEKFDATKGVYIVADGPLYAGDQTRVSAPAQPEAPPAPEKRRPGRPPKKEVPVTSVRTTAIARSAGG